MMDITTKPDLKKALSFLLVGVLYYLAGSLGLELATINDKVSPIWPASGVAFLSVLFLGRQGLFVIYLGAFLFNLKNDSPINLAAIIALGNTLEALFATEVYQWIRRTWFKLGDSLELIAILGAIVGGVWISAIVGVYSLIKFEVVSSSIDVFKSLYTWWIGDALGILVLGPIYYLFKNQKFNDFSAENIGKTFLVFCLSLFVGWTIFKIQSGPHLIFLINLFLLAICAFFNVKKAFFAMLGVYLYTIFIIFQKSDSFIQQGDENLNFVNLQIIFMGVSLSFIVFSHIPKKLLKSFISLILIFIWVLGSFLVSYTYYIEKSKVDTEVSSAIDSMESQFKEHIENYAFALAFASTLLSIEGEVSNEKWQEMSSQLKITERYPGIFGLGFIYSMDRKDISNWIRNYNFRNKVNVEYKTLYSLSRQSGIQPDRAFIISAIEPLSNNVSVLGLDVATEENRYAAAIKSIHLRTPTITNRIRLKNAESKPYGFLYYHPTFNKWTSQFVGWAYAVFIWEDFFKKIVSTHSSPLINYSIGLLDFSNQDLLVKSKDFDSRSEAIKTSDIPFADKYIRLTWQINPEYIATQFTHISWISAVISIISLLLYSLVISMIQSKEKIAAMVILKEEELKESQFQLLQASKLSSLGEMAGGIAHEINNPLAIIRARAGLLRQQANNNKITPEKIIESTDVIDKTILRVTKIIDGLRSFSRAPSEAEPYLPMTVSSIIESTLLFCNEKFKNHGIELKLSVDQSLMIKARETQLSQVILNLLNNSYDAIEDQENPWIEIKVSSEGNFAVINIKDSGEGIADSVAEKMMQPFYTTKEVGKGTGLGLSISSRIVQEHGGILSFDRGQKNTSFTLKIPLH